MNIYKYILLFGIVSLLFTSCKEDTVSDPVDPSYKPMATVTTDFDASSTNEADGLTIVYNITIDKAVSQPINFVAHQIGGDADSNDYEVENGTIAAYTNSTQVKVKILNDGLVENTETLNLEIVPQGSDNSTGWSAEHNHFMLNSNSSYKELSLTIENALPSNFLMQLAWSNDLASDLDVFAFAPDGSAYSVQGTGDNPEIAEMIAANAPDGVYKIGIDPYSVNDGTTSFDLNWAFSEPNGEVTFINQNFDYENRFTVYNTLLYTPWGTNAFIMLEVTKTGSDFVVNSL